MIIFPLFLCPLLHSISSLTITMTITITIVITSNIIHPLNLQLIDRDLPPLQRINLCPEGLTFFVLFIEHIFEFILILRFDQKLNFRLEVFLRRLIRSLLCIGQLAVEHPEVGRGESTPLLVL